MSSIDEMVEAMKQAYIAGAIHTATEQPGTPIQCPVGHVVVVYHLDWSALVCESCALPVDKGEWRLAP